MVEVLAWTTSECQWMVEKMKMYCWTSWRVLLWLDTALTSYVEAVYSSFAVVQDREIVDHAVKRAICLHCGFRMRLWRRQRQ